MEEAAFLAFQRQVPLPDLQALTSAFVRAQRCYAAHGIATVQEGLLPEQLFPVYQALLQRSLLTLDTVAFPSPEAFDRACALFPSSGYERRLRIGGMKIFLDGSPQGRTAWLRKPYAGSDDCAYGTMTDAQVEGALRQAAARGVQLLAHCNGDAAAAQFLRAVRAVSAEYPNFAALRPVMIHAQLLGLDQLEEVRALGILPSFFVAHVYHFGDVHLQNLGVSRAAALSPARSALQAGIRFTFHQDAPVIEPDMLETLWCATCRKTRAGVWLGPDQAIGTEDALRAVTANAAYQYFEEGEKGTLRPGKRADLVLLSGNPLTTPPQDLRSLQVEATIRGGQTVYRRYPRPFCWRLSMSTVPSSSSTRQHSRHTPMAVSNSSADAPMASAGARLCTGMTRFTLPVDSAANRHSHTSARSAPQSTRFTSVALSRPDTLPSVPEMAAAPSEKRNTAVA